MRTAVARGSATHWQAEIAVGPHVIRVDEPADVGGGDTAPTPHDLLIAALGACTAITVRMYAERKGWPLTGIRVALEQEVEGGGASHRIRRVVHLEGALDDEQRARLLDIANKCPTHKTLTHPIHVETSLAPTESPADAAKM